MNEGKKTGLFWGTAAVVAGVAALVAWPRPVTQADNEAGQMLFETFTDPLAAASMKVVTFDETQGTLDTFEVRKDRESGLWTIPSREGYPADAIEQMKDAANALVGVKILDIQTENAEDHDDLGVSEPSLEDLEVGDEGVGRLVTFKNEGQDVLASLIIGDALKDDPSKRYVRIPNQDPVYVVKFDESPLTTNFRDWIEDDLLQLSSIDIDSLQIKDYTATLAQRGISLSRQYTADIKLDGAQYELVSMEEFDPNDPRVEGKSVGIPAGKELNKTKLNELKNALDDLKIVNVFRKPEGVSATLKASADLLSDQDAIASLAQRGFYPIEAGADGQAEILSANGELSVSLKDGVKYLIRFGNIAGVGSGDEADSKDGDADEEGVSDSGVNRYLFVTTMVDESKFPVPELRAIPQTLEELDAMLNPPKIDEPAAEADETAPKDAAEPAAAKVTEMKEAAAEEPAEKSEADVAGKEEAGKEGQGGDEKAADEKADETTEPMPAEPESAEKADEPADAEPTADDAAKEAGEETADKSGETETAGEGEASGTGQAQDGEAAQDEDADVKPADASEDKPSDGDAKSDDQELTQEELQERLEAEQEKITKENQRKLDARKDQLEIAEHKVRELNERFADWYYVIPEGTYTQLHIKRDDLFGSPTPSAPPSTGGPSMQMPSFGNPGAGFPGN